MTPKKTSLPSDGGTLTVRQLNRALLERQMLLRREKVTPLAAVERLVGMQAQVPRPPFMGLWTRLRTFEREDLARLLRDRKVVRATALRGTIHLMSAKDYLGLRPALAPMLAKGALSIVGKKLGGANLDDLYSRGRAFFATAAPFDDLRGHLERELPKLDVRAMAYAIRMGVPLVMVPTDATWSFPQSAGFISAEDWLGKKVPATAAVEELVLRYLAAFGPATPGDFQTWSFIAGARETFEKLRPRLVSFRDARKRELFDLPDAPRPDEDTPAPIRFLAEFDNALLAHDDRARIIADEHRKHVFTKNLLVLGTVLIDGFVAATWKLERKKKDAALTVTPFGKIPKGLRGELEEEGERLLQFLEPDAGGRSVVVAR